MQQDKHFFVVVVQLLDADVTLLTYINFNLTALFDDACHIPPF